MTRRFGHSVYALGSSWYLIRFLPVSPGYEPQVGDGFGLLLKYCEIHAALAYVCDSFIISVAQNVCCTVSPSTE